MPAELTHTREADLAQALLDLVGEGNAEKEVASRSAGPFGGSHRRRNDVGRVGGILLPVDVVVVHHADHQRIQQRRRHRVHLLPGDEHRRTAGAGDLSEDIPCEVHVMLLSAAKRAAHRVHQESFGLRDNLGRQIFIRRAGSPFRNLCGDCRHSLPPRELSKTTRWALRSFHFICFSDPSQRSPGVDGL